MDADENVKKLLEDPRTPVSSIKEALRLAELMKRKGDQKGGKDESR